jgi:hypothetical protein
VKPDHLCSTAFPHCLNDRIISGGSCVTCVTQFSFTVLEVTVQPLQIVSRIRRSNISFECGQPVGGYLRFSPVSTGKMGRYLEINHDHFLSYASQFIMCIYCNICTYIRIFANFWRCNLRVRIICKCLKRFHLNNSKIDLVTIVSFYLWNLYRSQGPSKTVL